MPYFTLESAERPPEPNLLAGLNEAQQEAVRTLHGPVLIIAGPGSGKTRTVTHRIAHLLATGTARPWNVLALTFTNKAAREMQERITHLVGPEASKGITMGTFHATFARLLRVEAERIGYSRDFSIYDTDDSERIMRGLMERYHVDSKMFTPRSLRALISSAKNAMVGPMEYAKFVSSPAQEKAALLYGPYEQALRAANALDFDDLLLRPIGLFTHHPDVLEKYQDKWTFIHIDEYQDTNHAQYKIAQLLAHKHGNLCVVGDDAQSIYAFRGADIGNILSFQKDYPKASVIRLEENYRSTQRILDVAEAVIQQNKGQLKKSLRTRNPLGEHALVLECLSEKDEAMKVERFIRDLHIREGIPLKGFAILYRTNAQSRSFEDALRRADLPYRLVGGTSFYQRKEIKDALAYLRLLVNPNDTASLRRVINYPARGIGDKSVEELMLFAQQAGITLWQALERVKHSPLKGTKVVAMTKFHFMIAHHASSLTSTPAHLVARKLLNESGLLPSFQQEDTPENQARWDNVQELLNALAEHVESEEGRNLSTFLQEVTLLTDADAQDDDPNRITLMTLHASKGLEFPVVFVVGLEEGLFPMQRSTQDLKDLEEERRLFYVGVTRAERRLFLSYARSRFQFGATTAALRSRFLDELRTDAVRMENGMPLVTRGRFSAKDTAPADPVRRVHDPAAYAYRTPLSTATAPAVKPHTTGAPSYRKGARVYHEKFGDGVITAVEGSGDAQTLAILFEDAGERKLKAKFAKLRLL